jgi:hypothetical protein
MTMTEARTVKKPRSYNLQVELTNHCNFRCTFCPHAYYGEDTPLGNRFDRPKGFISQKVFDTFLSEADKHAATVTLGFFGEQMLHPMFTPLVASIPKQRAYKVILFTNWSYRPELTYQALRNVDDLRISLDAADAATFSKVRPTKKARFFDPYATIDQAVRDWLQETKRPPTTLMHTESSLNQGDAAKFVAKYRPLLRSTDAIVCKSVISYGGVTKDSTMQPHPCNVLDQPRMTVAWNGDCTPCNLDVNVTMKVGNIMDPGGLAGVVAGPRYRITVAGIRRREDICVHCPDSNNHTRTVTIRGTKK